MKKKGRRVERSSEGEINKTLGWNVLNRNQRDSLPGNALLLALSKAWARSQAWELRDCRDDTCWLAVAIALGLDCPIWPFSAV